MGLRRWLLIATCLLTGCQEDGRVHLSGSVTWKGQPVPAGLVFFSPDIKAGNQLGPQGIAPIVDGHYDTRGKDGRRVMSGPQRVSIQGFDGKGVSDGERLSLGKRLFMPPTIEVTVSEKSGSLDLAVPDDVEALH